MVFSPPLVMRIQLRSTCGSKHWVRLHSIFCLSTEPIFISRSYLVLFWYLDLIDPPPRPPLGKTPQKPRPHEDTCNRWFCPSQFLIAPIYPRPPIYLTLHSTLLFGGKRMLCLIYPHWTLDSTSTANSLPCVSRYQMSQLHKIPRLILMHLPSKPLLVVPITWQPVLEPVLSHL